MHNFVFKNGLHQNPEPFAPGTLVSRAAYRIQKKTDNLKNTLLT